MSLKTDLEAQIATLQAQLAIVNRIPEDTFSIGTVTVFSAASGVHWYYLKVGEESWRPMTGTTSKTIAEWIFEATQTNVGYFEVYTMSPAASPIFASA